MTRLPKPTPDRRTLLSALGTGLATSLIGTGATAAQSGKQYVLVQDDDCVPVRPIRGDDPADAFYEYQLPEKYVSEDNGAVAGESASYASAGTRDLQRDRTSIAFLYAGPEGLSLVVVHGSVQNDDAGSVTFELSGLPEDGEWLVEDDLYRDPDTGEIASTNYDRWDVDGTDHRIDWTWGSSGTDGGVFRDLGDEFDLTIDPAFNEAASLYDEYYEGTVTDWEFLSGTTGDPERISLDLEEPIRIATGSCEGGTTPAETDQQTDQNVEQEQNIDVEQEQEIEADQEVETEQKQEVKTEQEQRMETVNEDEEEEEEEEDEGRGKGHDKDDDGEDEDEDEDE